jgi:hypothetical protein
LGLENEGKDSKVWINVALIPRWCRVEP